MLLLFLTSVIITSCSTIRPVENIDEVQKIVFIWIPVNKIKEEPISISIEEKNRINSIIEIINNSIQIDPKKIPFIGLIEGQYFFEIYYPDGIKKIEVFGNGAYLTDSNETAFFRNQKIYFFIQQLLYHEYIKRGIKIQ